MAGFGERVFVSIFGPAASSLLYTGERILNDRRRNVTPIVLGNIIFESMLLKTNSLQIKQSDSRYEIYIHVHSPMRSVEKKTLSIGSLCTHSTQSLHNHKRLITYLHVKGPPNQQTPRSQLLLAHPPPMHLLHLLLNLVQIGLRILRQAVKRRLSGNTILTQTPLQSSALLRSSFG